jgi:hypothetical protein
LLKRENKNIWNIDKKTNGTKKKGKVKIKSKINGTSINIPVCKKIFSRGNKKFSFTPPRGEEYNFSRGDGGANVLTLQHVLFESCTINALRKKHHEMLAE